MYLLIYSYILECMLLPHRTLTYIKPLPLYLACSHKTFAFTVVIIHCQYQEIFAKSDADQIFGKEK